MLATLRILKWNKVPISEPYKHIPREYEEVKNYICDLLTIFDALCPILWYASVKRIVDTLCLDYQKLNSETISEREPIPRVQDILDGFGVEAWFSNLDMSKAYHQGFKNIHCLFSTLAVLQMA